MQHSTQLPPNLKKAIPGVGPEYWTPVRDKGRDYNGWKPGGILLAVLLLTFALAVGLPLILNLIGTVTSTVTGLTSSGLSETSRLHSFFQLCIVFGVFYGVLRFITKD